MGVSEITQFAFAGLKNGAIYALIALGFTIVYAATGIINFAQGQFYVLGGMLAAYAFGSLGLPLPLAAVLGVAATMVAGVLFELAAIRPKRNPDMLSLIIITIGGSILIESLTRHALGPDELSMPAFTPGPSVGLLGAAIERQTLWVWALMVAVVALLSLVYARTRFGRAMRACAVNREAAALMGIDTRRMVTASFAMAAALGAMAGVAVIPLTPIAFYAGPGMGVKGFAAAILGGLGSPMAAVAGGIVLGLMESMSVAFVPSTVRDVVPLGVLLVVLLVRPQGLFGRAAREKV